MLVVTPTSEAFAEFDDDGNKLLDVDEVRAHRDAILARFEDRVRVVDPQGSTGERYFADVVVPHAFDGTAPDGTDHLRFLMRYQFAEPPTDLTLTYDLFTDAEPLIVLARRAEVDPDGRSAGKLPDKDDYTLALTPHGPSVNLFGPEGAQRRHSAWSFFRLGFVHVLEGLDHQLFLLAIVIAAPRLRGVVAPITAFSIAHTLSVVAVGSDWITVPTGPWVEALIALSIAGIAWDNVRSGERSSHRWPLVFAFGLIHGLGFATALRDAMAGASPLEPLVAFTIAAELGQLLAAGVAWLAVLLVTKLIDRDRLRMAVSWALVAIGTAWFFLRIVG